MTVSATEAATRQLFSELKPEDRVELTHEVKVGLKRWSTRTAGTVVRTERRRHGLHFRRNLDDKVFAPGGWLRSYCGDKASEWLQQITVHHQQIAFCRKDTATADRRARINDWQSDHDGCRHHHRRSGCELLPGEPQQDVGLAPQSAEAISRPPEIRQLR